MAEIDYKEIGRRIAARRRELGLRQSDVEESADIGYKYLSNIERGISIPSVEVIMRLAKALDTTPDTFLVGTFLTNDEEDKEIDILLKRLNNEQLKIAKSFLKWLITQD